MCRSASQTPSRAAMARPGCRARPAPPRLATRRSVRIRSARQAALPARAATAALDRAEAVEPACSPSWALRGAEEREAACCRVRTRSETALRARAPAPVVRAPRRERSVRERESWPGSAVRRAAACGPARSGGHLPRRSGASALRREATALEGARLPPVASGPHSPYGVRPPSGARQPARLRGRTHYSGWRLRTRPRPP